MRPWRKPLVPHSSLAPPAGPLSQLSLAHLSAGESAEIRPAAPQCVPAPNALPFPQSRIGFPGLLATLHTPLLAPGSEGGGVAGRSGTPRPASTWPEGRRQGERADGKTPCLQTRTNWASRRGSRRLRSPCRACPALCTNRSHIQGESSRARPLPLPRLTAPEPMARRRGRAGLRGR